MPYLVEGACDCQSVRYRMGTASLIVHCCHCRWCQRESGASFARNAMIESDRVTSLSIAPELTITPSQSGRRQQIARRDRIARKEGNSMTAVRWSRSASRYTEPHR